MTDSPDVTPEEFAALPTEEAETPAEDSSPKETAEETSETEEEKPKQTVPYDRFHEKVQEIDTLKKDIEELKATRQERPLTPEEQSSLEAKKYLKGIIEEVVSEKESLKAQEEAKAVAEFHKEAERLGSVYQDFNSDKVVEYANKHELDNLETAYWRMKAEGKPTSETPKPKVPKATATSETVKDEKLIDTSGMDLWQAAKAAKEKLGLK